MVDESTADINVQAYPNPFMQYTTISVEGVSEQLNLQVFDMNGKLLLERAFTSSVDLERNELSVGVNVYKISRNDQLISSGRIILQ